MDLVAPAVNDIITDTLEKCIWDVVEPPRANVGIIVVRYFPSVLDLFSLRFTKFDSQKNQLNLKGALSPLPQLELSDLRLA